MYYFNFLKQVILLFDIYKCVLHIQYFFLCMHLFKIKFGLVFPTKRLRDEKNVWNLLNYNCNNRNHAQFLTMGYVARRIPLTLSHTRISQ